MDNTRIEETDGLMQRNVREGGGKSLRQYDVPVEGGKT